MTDRRFLGTVMMAFVVGLAVGLFGQPTPVTAPTATPFAAQATPTRMGATLGQVPPPPGLARICRVFPNPTWATGDNLRIVSGGSGFVVETDVSVTPGGAIRICAAYLQWTP